MEDNCCENCWYYDIMHCCCDDGTPHDPTDPACNEFQDAYEDFI